MVLRRRAAQKKRLKVMEINIYNRTTRYITPKYNISGLKKGEKYWVERICVAACHTDIYIEGRENPMNSVHFLETDIFAKIGEKNINRIAIIDIPKDIVIDISGCFRETITKEEMINLKKGEYISLGRSGDNDKVVGEDCKWISRYHCLIYNNGKALVVLDCSTNGTSIVI